MQILNEHSLGEIEAVVSVGVLAEGWDNPNCNIIVHMRPTLSKVLWGQSVGRGLRSAKNKEECLVIDVSSNWSTFGPVEKLKWSLWSHRGSYLRYKNRFQWIAQQPVDEQQSYYLCDNKLETGLRCSHVYLKDKFSDSGCPVCNSYSAIDIHKEQKMEDSVNDIGLHRLFFERIPIIYDEMNKDIWRTLGKTAWTGSEKDELIFLCFCKSFEVVTGKPSLSDSEFWNYTLQGEAAIRHFLVENKIQIVKSEEFDHEILVDGLMHGRRIRSLQANHGILLCGQLFENSSSEELERKYQRALQIVERLTVMGCSSQDNLPYFKAKNVIREIIKMVYISPSILACDFGILNEEISKVVNPGADSLHLDVMDGKFVPNISFGLPIIENIRKNTDIFLDTHLMIEEPIRLINDFAKIGVNGITIHFEACSTLETTISKIKEVNCLAGLAINPDTHLFKIEKYIDEIDLLLVMTVNPGFGGQKFLESSVSKIREAKN